MNWLLVLSRQKRSLNLFWEYKIYLFFLLKFLTHLFPLWSSIRLNIPLIFQHVCFLRNLFQCKQHELKITKIDGKEVKNLNDFGKMIKDAVKIKILFKVCTSANRSSLFKWLKNFYFVIYFLLLFFSFFVCLKKNRNCL